MFGETCAYSRLACSLKITIDMYSFTKPTCSFYNYREKIWIKRMEIECTLHSEKKRWTGRMRGRRNLFSLLLPCAMSNPARSMTYGMPATREEEAKTVQSRPNLRPRLPSYTRSVSFQTYLWLSLPLYYQFQTQVECRLRKTHLSLLASSNHIHNFKMAFHMFD